VNPCGHPDVMKQFMCGVSGFSTARTVKPNAPLNRVHFLDD
jgi:hypothetical protein